MASRHPMGLYLAISIAASGTALAQDAQTRLVAANCSNCHGTDGRSQSGMPMLAGLDRAYFVEQMQDFKSGKRPATIMHQLAKGYTEAEVEALATHFSSMKR